MRRRKQIVFGQIEIVNSSFELDMPGGNVKPTGWDTCRVAGTIIAPCVYGNYYFKPAAHFNQYSMSLSSTVASFDSHISTKLPCNLVANKKHTVSMFLFTFFSHSTLPESYGSMRIYGSNSPCTNTELLWTSPITDTNWHSYTATFVPSSSYNYLTFAPLSSLGLSYECNIAIDGISPIYIENLTEITATASATEVKAGEAVQLQSIINSNLIQPPYSITWHSSLNNFSSAEQNPGVVMPIITTTYNVELKDSCGYKAWDSVVVHVNSGGKVYYDFSNQKIKVVFGSDEATEQYQLTLYNTLGQRIATETLPLNIHEYEYSTAGLAKAMYYVSVRSGSGKVFGGKVLID